LKMPNLWKSAFQVWGLNLIQVFNYPLAALLAAQKGRAVRK